MNKNKPVIEKWEKLADAEYSCSLEMKGFVRLKDIKADITRILRDATSVEEIREKILGKQGG